MSSVKLISINIELHKHIDLILPFFKKENADVICLQEVLEPDFVFLKNELQMKGVFAPMANISYTKFSGQADQAMYGVAILSVLPIQKHDFAYYFGEPNIIHKFDADNMDTINRPLLSLAVSKSEEIYTIATTHFTCSEGGIADDRQRRDIKSLLKHLDSVPSFVLCGDFNAPRGREIFDVLAAHYKDNIPQKYQSTIDPTLHRVKDLQLVVDGLFSTSSYLVSDVRLLFGLSDHCAIIGEVDKA